MSQRMRRVAVMIQRELSQMIALGEVRDPAVSPLVALSDVEVTRDFQHATIYFRLVGGTKEAQNACLAGLIRSAGYMRGLLGRRIRLRHVPKLQFRCDTSFDYSAHMHRLLHDLNIQPESADPEATEAESADPEATEASVSSENGRSGETV